MSLKKTYEDLHAATVKLLLKRIKDGSATAADNAAALAGGLVAGDIYRTGDLLKIVHA